MHKNVKKFILYSGTEKESKRQASDLLSKEESSSNHPTLLCKEESSQLIHPSLTIRVFPNYPTLLRKEGFEPLSKSPANHWRKT